MLALGGGGARGFSHIGVLSVMEELGLGYRGIAGTSMGAVVGAMYLTLGSAEAVVARWQEAFEQKLVTRLSPLQVDEAQLAGEHPLLQAARRFRNRVVISVAINRSTIADGEDLRRVIDFLIPDIAISELPCPFVAVATDLENGEEVALGEGSLRRAVLASSSVPSVVPPIEIGGRLLVDGGTVAEIPVAAASGLGYPVVAVDVSMDLPVYSPRALVLHTLLRTRIMTSILLRRAQLKGVHLLIRPQAGHVTWSDWSRFEELVEAGAAATREAL